MGWLTRSRHLPRRIAFPLILTLTLALLGCDIPAQMVWSPDGTQAAYRAGGTAFLLNEQGIVLQPLGASMGGFVWAPDSKSLYFAVNDEDHNPPTPLRLDWLGPINDPATAPSTQPAAEPKKVTAVNVLANGKIDTLFWLADVSVWYMQLSADGTWLAVIATAEKEKDDSAQEFRLYTYSIRGKRLYELSRYCGLGACFSGTETLTFAEASGVDAVGQLSGHIVQVKLDDSANTLPRKALLETMVPLTGWMEGCKGGLIFTAAPRQFPATPVQPTAQALYKLFHFSCADSGLSVLADDVGSLFDVSPDGKHILYDKLTPPDAAATRPSTSATAPTATSTRDDLCVMNANGSDSHVLRSLDEYIGSPNPPMWPAWHGNDQITFIAKAETAQQIRVDDHDRKVLDVIQYHLTETGKLEPLQSLSTEWNPEIKPYFHREGAR